MQALSTLMPVAANAAQHVAAFVQHTVQSMRDLNNAQDVAAVGELTAFEALEYMQRTMMSDRAGRAILKNKPLVTDDVLQRARTMPPHTFGYHYARYMTSNNFLPSQRPRVLYISDPDMGYIITRYRQCHDFLHICAECGRTVEEEVAVKLLEWHHTSLPLGLLSIPGAAPHMTRAQMSKLWLYYQWAQHNAPTNAHGVRSVRMYLTVPWEELLSTSMEDVLSYTGLTPLPRYMAEQAQREQRATLARTTHSSIQLHRGASDE